MNGIIQIKNSLRDFLFGFSIILRKSFRMYLIVPLLISLLIYLLEFYFAKNIAQDLSNWLLHIVESFDLPKFILKGIQWSLKIILWLFTFYIGLFINKYLTLILLSPFLAILSEKTETYLTGKEYPFSITQIVKESIRGIKIAIRNLITELTLTILFFLIALSIPFAGWLLSIIGMHITSWYFYGFSMFDYYNERKNMKVKDSVNFILKNKWAAIANGFCFWLLFTIPLIGVLVAPLVAVIAATKTRISLDK